MLGLTFTRKAAAELGRRIRRRLAQWRARRRARPARTSASTWPNCSPASRPCSPTPPTPAGWSAEHALRLGAEPDARLISPGRRAGSSPTRCRAAIPTRCPTTSARRRRCPRYVLAMSGQFADHLVDARCRSSSFCRRAHRLVRDAAARPGDPRRVPRQDQGVRRPRCGTALELLPLVRAFAAAKAALPAVDFADQMTLAAELAAAARGRRDRAQPLSPPCCSTSTRTPVTPRSRRCAGCSATAIRSPRSATRSSRSTAGAARAPATSAGSRATFPRADGAPATVFPLADELPQRPR